MADFGLGLLARMIRARWDSLKLMIFDVFVPATIHHRLTNSVRCRLGPAAAIVLQGFTWTVQPSSRRIRLALSSTSLAPSPLVLSVFVFLGVFAQMARSSHRVDGWKRKFARRRFTRVEVRRTPRMR